MWNTRKHRQTCIQLWVQIERRDNAKSEPYQQKIHYKTDQMNATVATMLTDLSCGDFVDDQGNPVSPVTWQCSCLQKKCGACAMVVNGLPKLACDCFLRDYPKGVTLTPLRKFPVITDLLVDRSILFENLKTMEVWMTQEAQIPDTDQTMAFEASKCLQCGCCLEVCPNFCGDTSFCGAAGFVPTTGVLTALPAGERGELLKRYQAQVYEGCGKSLSCHAICPAGIDLEHMLIRANKIAFWKK